MSAAMPAGPAQGAPVCPEAFPTREQVLALADAVWLVLDDMGEGAGASCCLYAKAKARIAYDPFIAVLGGLEVGMSMDEARRVVAPVDGPPASSSLEHS